VTVLDFGSGLCAWISCSLKLAKEEEGGQIYKEKGLFCKEKIYGKVYHNNEARKLYKIDEYSFVIRSGFEYLIG